MPRLTINGRDIEVPEGSTVLEAARKLGIEIPSLCFMQGFPARASCMVCVVEDIDSHRLIPSCSAAAEEGMKISTDSQRAVEARKNILGLLLDEHAGDCSGPCTSACPAGLDIPVMLRLVGADRLDAASALVRRTLLLPSVIGRICPAPCEAACRRRQHDAPVAVRLVERFAADNGPAADSAGAAGERQPAGLRVAVIGAGPAGLAAAVHLQRRGRRCVVYDEHDRPGGMLRYGVPESELPRDILEAELAVLQSAGFELRLQTRIGTDTGIEELLREFEAVVLAAGAGAPAEMFSAVLAEEHVFSARSAGSRMAVKAVAAGASAALEVHRYLNGHGETAAARRYESRLGRLRDGELEAFLRDTCPDGRTEPSGGAGSGFAPGEARRETGRCLACDCRRKHSCRLRETASRYAGKTSRRSRSSRRLFSRITDHPDIVYEPGKCILCGRCIAVAEAAGEPLGLAFTGRGLQTMVDVPFGEPLARGLTEAAARCVETCPTGALAFKLAGKEELDPLRSTGGGLGVTND